MGCGASKGAEAVAPTTLPNPPAPKTEFTPDNKPSLAPEQQETAPTAVAVAAPKETAKRVDDVVETGVADFEDDTDPKQDTSVEAPVPVAPVPALPPPPSTPPVGAQKPAYQTSTSNGLGPSGLAAADSTDMSYFPEQVALKIGGGGSGGGAAPQAAGGRPPPIPGGFQALSGGGGGSSGGGGFQTVASTRQLSQQQQPAFSAVPSGRMQQQTPPGQPLTQIQRPSLQSQPQPLSESGPGPLERHRGSGSNQATSTGIIGSGSAAGGGGDTAAAGASSDPWSSLQSQYRIRDSAAMPRSPEVGKGSLYGPGATGAGSGAAAGGSRGSGGAGSLRGAPPDVGKEVLVLGEDDDVFSGGHGMTLNSTLNRTARGSQSNMPVAAKPATQPKKGGWGSGDMARAGDLMIGEDDWLERDRPPGGSGSLVSQLPPPPVRQPAAQAVVSYSSGKQRADFDDHEMDHRQKPVLKGPAVAAKGPAAKGKGEDVLCEDIEDVDTLLEDEMERHGLTNKNLASKLAAYEAQFRDDD